MQSMHYFMVGKLAKQFSDQNNRADPVFTWVWKLCKASSDTTSNVTYNQSSPADPFGYHLQSGHCTYGRCSLVDGNHLVLLLGICTLTFSVLFLSPWSFTLNVVEGSAVPGH
jgi:hypothetical protein